MSVDYKYGEEEATNVLESDESQVALSFPQQEAAVRGANANASSSAVSTSA